MSWLVSSFAHLDASTPIDGGHNYQTNGAPTPPRDGREEISDLLDLFQF